MESLLLQDVYKIYKEGDIETVALRGANLVVQPGEFVAITGRSGAGKSTLLNIMGGLAVPSAGKVLINGLDIAKMGESERSLFRRQNIGVIFQTDNLIPFLTALENVMLPLQFAGRRHCTEEARNLLSEVGLQNRIHHKPGMLSGGERQRVAIAIALANHPGLLLADELTGELDTATAEQVMTLLAGLNSQRNLTLIIVTHNKVVANRANRQVHIMDGQLTEITNQIARN
ncbi:MAG: ABC transporter ATP-binding protein [Chloroflexi bacterium]|jgi:ABC-type lipoprotein export system ATPase subunit|nr:ABC transporter ATP-binding protein [Chloroflexota bacterium]